MNPQLPTLAALATVVLLGASAGLAAIIGPHGGVEDMPEGSIASIPRFDGAFTFRPTVATDVEGRLLPPEAVPVGAPHAVQRLLSGGGAEPTLGVTAKGNVFVVVGEDVQRSSDQGRTWTTVHTFTTPNFPDTHDRYTSVDPMLWVDAVTSRVFVLHMTPAPFTQPPVSYGPWCADLSWSDDEGASWERTPLPGTFCDTPLYFDHPKILTAPYGPRTTLALGQATGYPHVLYLCNNKILYGTWCAVSYDGGRSIAHTAQVKGPNPVDATRGAIWNPDADYSCPGINGHPAAYPDGTVVVAVCGAGEVEPIVALTQDNGLTWTLRQFPGQIGQSEIDPDITVTPDGTAYFFFRGKDQMVHLLRSKDQFATWEGPFRVSPDDQLINAFTAITSGDDGRIAMAYLGTRTSQADPQNDLMAPEHRRPVEPSRAVPGTLWNLYVTTSVDAAAERPTFVTQQVNPEEDPVQVGCVWMGGGASPCRNLLDFIDISHDPEGRFYAAITDGCTPRFGCTADIDLTKFQSQDREVAVAVQDHGQSLFAAKGILPTLGLTAPQRIPR